MDPKATRVALLTNMVGPGEVDDDLEDEVADECEKKYGEVVRVVIYEVEEGGGGGGGGGGGVPDEERVRIFVEFRGSAATEVRVVLCCVVLCCVVLCC